MDSEPITSLRTSLTSSSSGPSSQPASSGDLTRQKPVFLLELIKFGDNEAEIKWVVKNFSRLEDEEVESEPFILGGIKWYKIFEDFIIMIIITKKNPKCISGASLCSQKVILRKKRRRHSTLHCTSASMILNNSIDDST